MAPDYHCDCHSAPGSAGAQPLLTALAACSAVDVEMITHKRAESTQFAVRSEGHKVRDVLSRAIRQSRDRLCTVSRTVQLGGVVTYERADGAPLE